MNIVTILFHVNYYLLKKYKTIEFFISEITFYDFVVTLSFASVLLKDEYY